MKKYSLRFLASFFIFSIGFTTICCTFQQEIKPYITSKRWHSIENGSPFSSIDGNKILIKPYGATFEIPKEWLNYKREKNIFLNCGELEEIEPEYGIKFDEEDGQVIDSVVAFKDCAVHVGDKGWNNGNWNDIQGRVYITDMTLDEISTKIEKDGLSKASSVFEKAAVKSEPYGKWQHKSLEVLDAPTHFMLNKEICFYYRSYGKKRVIFAFLHADRYEVEIATLLNSFKWKS